tara:strand:+ start:55 stop:1335 length:1281 start_codon:yes stop_codon:yes gene_type:complete
MSNILQIKSIEILDSRGLPTVEVEVLLDDGSAGRASVPSGSSTGSYEAHELRDKNKKRYLGKGVLEAINFVNTEIKESLIGLNIKDQKLIDKILVELDGTENKSRIGANSILGVSLAVAKTASSHLKIPLHSYLGGIDQLLPTPMMNVVNGGCHCNNQLDFQEFMIVPAGFDSFKESLRAGSEIFHHLRNLLNKKGFSTSVGDEGGFGPDFKSNRECLDFLLKAIDKSDYAAGKHIFLGLDVASTEFFSNKKYHLDGEKLSLNTSEMMKYYENLIGNYPIISIEDGLSENDWDGWEELTNLFGEKCQLVGDDLFVTNIKRLNKGIEKKCGNSILIKLNQIGTLTETMNTINEAKKNNFNTVISHRSGETEDTFISDLAVGTLAGQIKTGSLSRSERVAKYNQLLRIEESAAHKIDFAGLRPFKRFL